MQQTALDEIVPRRAAAHIRAFCRDAVTALPQKIDKFVLFGSRARREASTDSDYDIAVFVDDFKNRRSVDHLLADIAYKHIVSGVHISPVSIPSDFLENADKNAFAQSLLRDGIEVR